MNTQQNPEGAPVVEPQRGGGRGGRGGRGGGRGRGRGSSVVAAGQPAVSNKIGPVHPAELSYKDDSSLKGKAFVVGVWAGEGLMRQVTFHRPIGVTPLSATRDWVATPSEEVGLLLERKSSEATARYDRAYAAARRVAVLAARTGRRTRDDASNTEEWSFEGSPPCGAHIKTLQELCKAEKKPDSQWLEKASEPIKLAERQFKQAMADTVAREAYERDHQVPAFETRGGPAGERPQIAVAYLRDKSFAAARDTVMGRLLGLAA
jgi:hypothetical protein